MASELLGESDPLIAKTKADNPAVRNAVSSILDIWKGLFVPFMLTEHTRSSLSVRVEDSMVLFVVSQVACALDMTTFSTAYGFACYQQYFANSTRSLGQTVMRLIRSTLLIYACGVLMNVLYAFQVERLTMSSEHVRDIFTLRIIYWDFIDTFLFLLAGGCFITGPALAITQRIENSFLAALARLVVFAVLLVGPLYLANERFNVDCATEAGRSKALILGCKRQVDEATRFPAVPYFFFFNLGCIMSMAVKEIQAGWKGSWTKPMLLYSAVLGTVVAFETLYALPLIRNTSVHWEELNPSRIEGYQRYPMNFRLALGWGLFSAGALLVAIMVHFSSTILSVMFEKLGANVLIHLTMNALMIHGFFRAQNASEKITPDAIVCGMSLFTIAATQLIIYLARSSRK